MAWAFGSSWRTPFLYKRGMGGFHPRNHHVDVFVQSVCPLLKLSSHRKTRPQECARLIDRARLAREGGPWLAFQDDQPGLQGQADAD